MSSVFSYLYKQKFFATAYKSAMQKLLPPGKLWSLLSTDIGVMQNMPSTKLHGTLLIDCIFQSVALECENLDAAALDLFNQQFPETATYALTDWERVLALPESGTPNTITTELRQTIAQAKLYAQFIGTLAKDFYIGYAAKFGFTITVDDVADVAVPFFVAPDGVDIYDIGARVGARLNSEYQYSSVVFTVTAGTGELALLQAILTNYIPAHIIVAWVDAR